MAEIFGSNYTQLRYMRILIPYPIVSDCIGGAASVVLRCTLRYATRCIYGTIHVLVSPQLAAWAVDSVDTGPRSPATNTAPH
ncbi:hypothetical protein SFRURICE_010683 [Spodoptera frugiperda]|nr:hypothetical protein SFRURICE_010683 [Spodoptera frugiperda]